MKYRGLLQFGTIMAKNQNINSSNISNIIKVLLNSFKVRKHATLSIIPSHMIPIYQPAILFYSPSMQVQMIDHHRVIKAKAMTKTHKARSQQKPSTHKNRVNETNTCITL